MTRSKYLISELAAQVGLRPSALRFYESMGLLQADGRSEARYRLFGAQAEHRVRFIKRARSLGMNLSEIRRLIESPRGAREQETAVLRGMIDSKITEAQSRIKQLQAQTAELRRVQRALDASSAPECGHLGDCACWLPT